MEKIFGPLDKKSCIYFLIITVIFFVSFVILVTHELFYIMTNLNKLNFRMFSTAVVLSFNVFLAYFVNRLMYSMCVKSL
jgi:hypothetical protein